MMITPFARPMATTKRLPNSVILPLSEDIHPFPEGVLVLLMVPAIFHCGFAGKISCLGARWECSSGTKFPLDRALPNPTKLTMLTVAIRRRRPARDRVPGTNSTPDRAPPNPTKLTMLTVAIRRHRPARDSLLGTNSTLGRALPNPTKLTMLTVAIRRGRPACKHADVGRGVSRLRLRRTRDGAAAVARAVSIFTNAAVANAGGARRTGDEIVRQNWLGRPSDQGSHPRLARRPRKAPGHSRRAAPSPKFDWRAQGFVRCLFHTDCVVKIVLHSKCSCGCGIFGKR